MGVITQPPQDFQRLNPLPWRVLLRVRSSNVGVPQYETYRLDYKMLLLRQ